MQKHSSKSKKLNPLNMTLDRTKDLKKRRYSTRELMKITGMTRKRISHAREIGLLMPSWRNTAARGSQTACFYSSQDVVKALIICEMKRRGFTPSQVNEVARNLKDKRMRLDESAKYLLTDGDTVYYAESATEVVDILKHKNQMLLIPVYEQVEKLRVA
jgi:DNA-binding transcriptional MerR regulator